MKKWLFIVSFLMVLFGSCGVREREQALNTRESALNQREQELLLREKTVELKEEELLKREKKLDSTVFNDTTAINPNLLGSWNVKMTCTEATCTGSAVGDTRNEQWHISYQDNNIIVRAMSGEQLVRVYTGSHVNGAIELTNDAESNASQPAVKMIVRLRMVNNKTMEGQREIIREGNCKIVYAMQMTKQ